MCRGAMAGTMILLATCSDATGPSRPPAVDLIQMEPASFTAHSVGEAIEFSARAISRDGEALQVALAWSSSDTSVLVHEGDGRFRTRANGVAVVNVRPAGNSALTWPTATVVVHQLAARLELASGITGLSGDTLTLFATGQTATIHARAFDALGVELTGAAAPEWSAANEAVVSVGPSGTVTAKADGETVVTLTAGALARAFVVRVASTFAISGCLTSAEASVAESCAGTQVSVRSAR
jgi:hypothetical protein